MMRRLYCLREAMQVAHDHRGGRANAGDDAFPAQAAWGMHNLFA